MNGASDDDSEADVEPATKPPWHNSTPAVIGATIAALAVIGLVVAAAIFLTRHFSEPDTTPADFVEATTSTTPTTADAPAPPTTTETFTSTSPPVTTDINLPSDTPTPSTDTSSSTTTSRNGRADDSEPSTTRRRPRYNETRTLYPPPVT